MGQMVATQTCFRIGTARDLMEGLRFAHQNDIPMPDRHWGLKLLGYAVCAQRLAGEEFGCTLEAGVGFGDVMHRAFGGTADKRAGREMWTIDNAAFYDDEQVTAGRAARVGCRDVNGLLGDFAQELPDEHFDAVFSISALEHAPMETVRSICEDLFRVTRPGGLSVHTLDFAFDEIDERIEPWLVEMRRAGFEIDPGEVDMTAGLTDSKGEAYLFEPIEIVFTNWCKRRIEDSKRLPRFTTQHAAVLVVARKPG